MTGSGDQVPRAVTNPPATATTPSRISKLLAVVLMALAFIVCVSLLVSQIPAVAPRYPGEWWSFYSFLASSTITAAAWVGFETLRVTRSDIDERRRYQQRLLSIQQGGVFVERIAAEYDRFLLNAAEAQRTYILDTPGDVDFDAVSPDVIAAAAQWRRTLGEGIFVEIVRQLNALEAWAMYFAPGARVAEEQTAFDVCGAPFCKLVIAYFPVLVNLRQTEFCGGEFLNVEYLYRIWSPRLSRSPART